MKEVTSQMDEPLQGYWIAYTDLLGLVRDGAEMKRFFLRRLFIPEADASLRVRVSASNRYRLYLNGTSVGAGPHKGHRATQYFDQYDLSAFLVPNTPNILAAEVIHYPYTAWQADISGPLSEVALPLAGFWLDGAVHNGQDTRERLDTDERWDTCENDAVQMCPHTVPSLLGCTMERTDGRKVYPHWNRVGAETGKWQSASRVAPVVQSDRMLAIEQPLWDLTAHHLPPDKEVSREFTLLSGPSLLTELNETQCEDRRYDSPGCYSWVLDAGALTTGYMECVLIGGLNAKMHLTYAESFQFPDRPTGQHKGVRDDVGGVLIGDSDHYILRRGPQVYEPFHFRTFRYVRVDLEVKSDPVTVQHIRYRETGYPLAVVSEFAASDPQFDVMWEVSLRTLQRCMHETYEDCPYYEQLQYVLDSRLESLFTYYVSGDDRLARMAIEAFHAAALPSGLVPSRSPAQGAQVIPSFALQWIGMLADHWHFFADEALIRRYRPTVDAILDWFDRARDQTGLVVAPGYWPFIDWVANWPNGIPPVGAHEPVAVLNAMYAVALNEAAELLNATGRPGVAAEYQARSGAITQQLRMQVWDVDRMLMRDGTTTPAFSQHAQAWAILAEIPDVSMRALAQRMVTDTELSAASYPGLFAVQQALEKVGQGEVFAPYWRLWSAMLQQHLTTWEEDGVGRRSDCHGWGSLPLYVFPAHILGVQPERPGFAKIRIAPERHGLTWARGTVVTPRGAVKVAWQDAAGKKMVATISVPAGVSATVVLNGQEYSVTGSATLGAD